MLKSAQKAFQSINGICDDGRCISSSGKEVSFACNRAWKCSSSLFLLSIQQLNWILFEIKAKCVKWNTLMCVYIRTSCTQLYFWDQIQTCDIRLIMYYLQMNKKLTARNVWTVRHCCEQKHRMKFCTLYSKTKNQ